MIHLIFYTNCRCRDNKMLKQPTTLGEAFEHIFQGVVTGIDEIYMLGRVYDVEDDVIEVFSHREAKNIRIEKDILKPMLKGEDISRYKKPDFKYYCIYPYKRTGNKTFILQENELSTEFPLAYQYLLRYRNELIDLRKKYKTNPLYWYSCHRGRSINLFESKRIITPEISLGCNMTIDAGKLYHNTKIYSLLPSPYFTENIFYWLGLLNSKVMWWFMSNTGYVLRGGYFVFKTNYLKPFPIRTIDFDIPQKKRCMTEWLSLLTRCLT